MNTSRSQTRWIALFISLAAAVVLALIASALFSTDKKPTPTTESLADDYDHTGLAAWAKLLDKQDHEVYTAPLAGANKALKIEDATIILVNPQTQPTAVQDRKLSDFVKNGGRVVIGGKNGENTAESLLGESLLSLSSGPKRLVSIPAALPQDNKIEHVVGSGEGSFASTGATSPLLRGATPARNEAVAVGKKLGRGYVVFLADTSIVENSFIGKEDNASFATAIAGDSSRPAYFTDNSYVDESFQPSDQTGLNALSDGWKAAIIGLAFALFIWLLARGHRFGPPERPRRELPPPRRKFVEAQAANLAATKQRAAATTELWEETRRELKRRCGLSEDPSEQEIRDAAEYVGLSDSQANSLVEAPSKERPDSPILVGQAYAKLISRNE